MVSNECNFTKDVSSYRESIIVIRVSWLKVMNKVAAGWDVVHGHNFRAGYDPHPE